MLPTKFRFLRPRARSQSGQRSKSFLSNNSKTTEANLTKIHRKVKHNEKVLRRRPKVKVRGQIVPKIVLHINY